MLGTRWARGLDVLTVRSGITIPTSPLTKRKILSCVASLWDPLGMVAPAMVEPRVAMQAMWDCQRGWDDALGEEDARLWIIRLEKMAAATTVVPRGIAGRVEFVHVFCDAGRDAYGAVAWAVSTAGATFLEAKTQVSPLKMQSIPRLELMSAVLGGRIARRCARQLSPTTTILWTDSVAVQCWVASTASRFKAFVAARVSELHEIQATMSLEVKRVDTADNPADALTKVKARTVNNLKEWVQGPGFIRNEKDWRAYGKANEGELLPDAVLEVRCAKTSADSEDPLGGLSERVSSWTRMKRVLARVLKAFRAGSKDPDPAAITKAEIILLGWAQANGNTETPSGLTSFIAEDGILRVRGRLTEAVGPPEVSTPRLLPPDSPITQKILQEVHAKEFHIGARQIGHFLHMSWGLFLPGARTLASKVVRNCPYCRLTNQRALTQPMGPLPEDRQKQGGPPFDSVAVDFFEMTGSRKAGRKKGRFLIVVCQVTRAVHIERVPGLTTRDFLDAWVRLACRRGVWPRSAVSDAAPTFRKGARVLKEWEEKWKAAMEQFAGGFPGEPPSIVWDIAVPHAPHRMGTVEALVKTAKRALYAGARRILGDEESDWETLTVQATFMINERPSDASYWTDLLQDPISANDLLHPYRRVRINPEAPETWAINVSQAVHAFWIEWQKQVPPNLLPRQRWDSNQKEWQLGDLVLVRRLQKKGIEMPKNTWPKGVVTQLLTGQDGVTRRVKLRLVTGKVVVAATPYLTLLMRESDEEAQ